MRSRRSQWGFRDWCIWRWERRGSRQPEGLVPDPDETVKVYWGAADAVMWASEYRRPCEALHGTGGRPK